MAEWGVKRFDDEFEEEENRATIPHFKKLIARCKPQVAGEEEEKAKKLKTKAAQEFDENFGPFNVNELLAEIGVGTDAFGSSATVEEVGETTGEAK